MNSNISNENVHVLLQNNAGKRRNGGYNINMLTGKQRSYLRSLANSIDPIFQVGKGGIGDNLVKQFNDALEARELIKVTVLKNAEAPVKDISEEVSGLTGADVVQVIGNRFVLYKESEKNRNIILP